VSAVLEKDKGRVVMITQSKSMSRFLLILGALLLFLPFSAQAQSTPPYIHLGNAVGAGQTVSLNSASAAPFVVPGGMYLLLTDFVFSPQAQQSDYLIQINAMPGATSQMTFQTLAAEPSSMQVHMTTGMMFPAGSVVSVSMLQGTGPINFDAFGSLLPLP
jgi:hypothetical protein